MPTTRETLLCRYHYDPLDRLTACTPSVQTSTQRFYLKERLATEIQGAVQRSIMQHDDQLLAQQQRESSTGKTTLLATDQQRSVLNALDAGRRHPFVYTPYGHRTPGGGLLSLLGFNGERPDPVTGWYLLGNGYRAFNPVLMRFNSPDSWSPFGKGGLNVYAYCVGDPVNRSDPTGHIPKLLESLLRRLGRTKKTTDTRVIQKLVPPTSIQIKDNSYNLVGFHGTSTASAQEIPKTGLHPKFMKPGFHGEGFYTTPNTGKALNYTKGGRPENPFSNNPDGMLAIYVKDPTKKIQGQDFTFHPGSKGTIDELRLLPKMYDDVKAIQFRPTGAAPELHINEIFNIRSGTNQNK